MLGTGDPKTAQLAINLEAPGKDEIAFSLFIHPGEQKRFYATQAEVTRELSIRKRDYPELTRSFIGTGVPIVGMSGHELFDWVARPLGIKREELFIDNTLRCLPPKNPKSDVCYPTGEERKAAEKCCRQYDRWGLMKPEVGVVTLHPASILRDVTPLPLQLVDLAKARDFMRAGSKTVVLAGGKSAELFLGHAQSNVTFWRGNYQKLETGRPRLDFVPLSELEASALASGKRARKPKREKGEKTTRRAKKNDRAFLKGTVFE